MTVEKDYALFGTKIINTKNDEVDLVLYTWINKFADADIPYATCVNRKGEKYNIALDEITPLD